MTTPISLASVTADTFKPLVGASFAITLPSAHATRGVLANVAERAPYPGAKRAPFSLHFEVPGVSGLRPEQGTIRIEHEALGSLDVFAVPVGAKGEMVTWEVVFG